MNDPIETLKQLREQLRQVKMAFQPALGQGMAPPPMPAGMDPGTGQPMQQQGMDPSGGRPQGAPPQGGELEQVIFDLSSGLDQLAQAFEQSQQQSQQQIAQLAQQVDQMQQVMTQMAEGLQVVKQNLLSED